MNIRIKKDWELKSSEITPESVYFSRERRKFLKTLGVGVAGAALLPEVLRAATGGFPAKLNADFPSSALKPTDMSYVTAWNNFYEFGTGKGDPAVYANRGWKTEPWTVELAGLVNKPAKFDVNDLIKQLGGIEERVYRHRCVEAWSMVIPWDGFPLAKLVALADPKPEAKFVKFYSFLDPRTAPGQADQNLDYPYVEGLRMDEARNELAFIATGIFGKALPNQNGAPLRLVVPWKYGFKGAKSIVKIEFTATQPINTWAPRNGGNEYGFYANVNPQVDHPRWSQASEAIIGAPRTGFSLFATEPRQPTQMFNGYEKQVGALYKGMDLKRNF